MELMLDASSTVAGWVPVSGLPMRLALLGDERLARLVEGGSERAFATIYERYHQRLYRYCYSVLRDGEDARDALQSTLAAAFAALQRGQRDAPLRSWLFRTAHNEAISLVRRRSAGEPTETLERCAPSAEDRAGERARLTALLADLHELPERQRGALLMRELSGLSHKEIAIALGISMRAVKRAILDARRSLVEFEEGRVLVCEDVRRAISCGDRRPLRHARVRAHLRDCAACAAFAAAIPARRADLQALVPPLPPVLAAGLLARLLGAGSGHGAGGAGGAGGVASGLAGKTAAATLAAKALVSVAIVATASAGVTGALTLARQDVRLPAAARTAHTAHARGAARHSKRVLGTHSSREGHHAAPAGVLDGRPRSAIEGDQVSSADKTLDISGGSGPVPRGANARGMALARGVGTPTRTGAGSQRGGRSAVRAHPAGSDGRSAVGRHPAGSNGRSAVEGHPASSNGRSAVEGHPGGPPASVSETRPPTTFHGDSAQPNHTQSSVGPTQNAAPSPPAPNAPISRPGESSAIAVVGAAGSAAELVGVVLYRR